MIKLIDKIATYANGRGNSITPILAMLPDPQSWLPMILVEMERVLRLQKNIYGEAVINSWFRTWKRQEDLREGNKYAAAVSEHLFGAALDIAVPASHQRHLYRSYVAWLRRVTDYGPRVGWKKYAACGRLTFIHIGWGHLIPRSLIKSYLEKQSIATATQDELWHKAAKAWIRGMQW